MRSARTGQFLPFGNLLVGNHPPPLTRRRVILCKLDDGGDGGTDDDNDADTGVDMKMVITVMDDDKRNTRSKAG